MMLQLNDDGVLKKVDEEKLITVNIDDLNEFINEKERLEQENKKLKELVIEVDNELEIRDTVCGAGKFRLEEWGKHRYHQFYKGDKELEDESVVIMLMELEKENKELKKTNKRIESTYHDLQKKFHNWDISLSKCREENKELKEINQDHQDHISLLEEEKINLQIKLQKIRDYAMENGEVKQDVIEKVVFE